MATNPRPTTANKIGASIVNSTELLGNLIDKVDEMYENARLDDTEGDFRDGARDYLIQVLDLLIATRDEENN
jgi:hypothetical protein